MELTRQEENRNKGISAGITIALFALLILFLIWFQIVTPNPPFPEGGGGGGQELALGMMDVGNDNIDFGKMGEVTDVVAAEKPTEETITTADGGEHVDVTETKPEVKENKTVITPVKEEAIVKQKTEAEKMREKFLKNSGKNGGGIGDNAVAGQGGSPDGDPFKNGTGGSGGGTGGGNGTGNGPGNGPGSGPGFGGGKVGVSLKGRTLIVPPKLPNDAKEEGRVVVDITVDSEGNVIEASPNGRGTTTSSAILKAKARQAALATKFNVDGVYEEQTGTITFVFSFN